MIMMDWIYTALILILGVAVLVSGFIKVLYVGFFVFLGIAVLAYIVKGFTFLYRSIIYKKSS